MRPNRLGKTAVIPARFVDGTFRYFYGGKLPKLRDGTICDLVVQTIDIEDRTFLDKAGARRDIEMLPDGETIFAAVSNYRIPANLKEGVRSWETFGAASQVVASYFPYDVFVQIVLKEPLVLQLRGTKLGRLNAVKCMIPALKNEEARSLNHAYHLVSVAFEPQSAFFGGNRPAVRSKPATLSVETGHLLGANRPGVEVW